MSAVDGSPAPSLTHLSVAIEPMRRRHLRSVVLIERADDNPGWSVGLFLSELSRPDDRRYLVATLDGKVVGFAGALYIDEDAHVTTVSVDPAVRGRSIATQLVRALVSDALSRRCTAMTLEVRASNEPAIALYRRFGFAPVGVRKNYYAKLKEDALIMWAHEIQSDEFGARLDGIDARLNRQTEPGEASP